MAAVVKVLGPGRPSSVRRRWSVSTSFVRWDRMIRRYLPKSTLITDHQPYLTAIAEELTRSPASA